MRVTTVQTVQRLHLGPFHRCRSGIFIVISGTTCHSVPHLGAGHQTEPHLSEVQPILAKECPGWRRREDVPCLTSSDRLSTSQKLIHLPYCQAAKNPPSSPPVGSVRLREGNLAVS
jgi:hypothetical protein